VRQRGFLTERAIVWLLAIAVCAGLWGLAVNAARSAKHAYDERRQEEGREQVRQQWRTAVDAENQRQAAIEAERRKKQETADEQNALARAQLAGDLAAARAAGSRLQQRVDALVAAARRQAGPAQPAAGLGPGVQGDDPIGVLALVLGRVDAAAGRIGQYADDLRARGQRCEAGYDAEVTP
jgi:hypothetical protein